MKRDSMLGFLCPPPWQLRPRRIREALDERLISPSEYRRMPGTSSLTHFVLCSSPILLMGCRDLEQPRQEDIPGPRCVEETYAATRCQPLRPISSRREGILISSSGSHLCKSHWNRTKQKFQHHHLVKSQESALDKTVPFRGVSVGGCEAGFGAYCGLYERVLWKAQLFMIEFTHVAQKANASVWARMHCSDTSSNPFPTLWPPTYVTHIARNQMQHQSVMRLSSSGLQMRNEFCTAEPH
ncbi:uncharacterized protein LOC130930262 isoform X2 [Corythoichthys intestinalis]|uniref:uncharacterized protein LOC130930262 isoform X2 n=1 Tax=Corythoichthys intestinalis TaxID=161448 RepID=UPI0025A4D927|nr:uncharacterized protein LOC130930262 isoform X2 [Corythoichthys intestinalis]